MGRIARAARRWMLMAGAGLLLLWGWRWIGQALGQLFLGLMVALAALPIMRQLEKRMKPALAATLSMLSLSLIAILSLLALAPPMVRQGRELAALLPGLYSAMEGMVAQGEGWLRQNGLPVDSQWRGVALERLKGLLGGAVPAVMAWAQQLMGSLGRWMLAPVFAFYFLRDRRRLCQWLLSLLPANRRAMAVRMVREMRRETAGYLRGQLLVSAVVGMLTALGLLICGVPAWLLLGILMGVLELIPYVGPVLGGTLAVLFALPGGWSRTLWALAVVVLVQQLEGTMLSPQLVSETTRLHPVAVLLLVALGGSAAGMAGILLAVPALLCLRAALRILRLAALTET